MFMSVHFLIRRATKAVIFTSLLSLYSNALSADADPLKVDNFVLLDHHGKAHELYYHRDAKAIVLVSQGNGCQIVRSSLEDLRAVRDDYSEQGVQVMLLNANQQDSRKSLAAEAEQWNIDFPILKDSTQLIAQSLKFARTGEVLVINTSDWTVAYRGPLNDRIDYERQKNKATNTYVRDALDSIIAGQEVSVSKINAPGCIINYDKIDGSTINYTDTIAPMLAKNCAACHIQGGIAPWAMSEYAMVKGFAPMMREVLRTKRMPPWHSDPEIGHWANDVSLSDDDKKILVAWIDAGAPRGEGEDPLKKIKPINNQWTMGTPDLVLDIPAFEIAASGTVEYQFPFVQNPYDKDVWVLAAEIIPGDPKAVHHILAGSSEGQPTGNLSEIFDNFILAYAPGNEASSMPEDTGVFVPKGGVYQFQMHYTPYGKKTVDRSKIGLYFSDQAPKNFYREHVVSNLNIKIPANAEKHEEKAYFLFDKAAEIHALFPHSHYRGVSSTFELEYPDGRNEVIMSVPNYDFNWQRTYRFKERKKVPAGTRIIHRTVYNNSSKNRGNPEPNQAVYWGLQSEQEMLYGSIGYSWSDETTSKPLHDSAKAEIVQMMGFMDQDMDDKVTQSELSTRLRRAVGENFPAFDTDRDGGLNVKEMTSMIQTMRAQRESKR